MYITVVLMLSDVSTSPRTTLASARISYSPGVGGVQVKVNAVSSPFSKVMFVFQLTSQLEACGMRWRWKFSCMFPGFPRLHLCWIQTQQARGFFDVNVQTIGIPAHTPSDDFLSEPSVKVSVNVTDSASGMKNVTLLYTINSWLTWVNLIMDNS